MKKLVLSLLLLPIFIAQSSANHIVGAELNYRIDAAGDIIFTANLYGRLSPQGSITFGGGTVQITNNAGININIPFVKEDTLQSSIAVPYGVRRRQYQGKVNVSSLNCNNCTFSFSYCCRSASANWNNSTGVWLDVQAFLDLSAVNSFPYSGPSFLSEPMYAFPQDTLWKYDLLLFDADGDSTYTSLVIPSTPNYSLPPSNPSGIINLSPEGIFSWNAPASGTYSLIYKVEKFNSAGVLTGSSTRDVLLGVNLDSSLYGYSILPPNISNTLGGIPLVDFTGDSTNLFTLPFYLNDTNAQIGVTVSGAPFEYQNSDAAFTVAKLKRNSDTLMAVFSWSPQAARKRDEPYRVAFSFYDGAFTYDYSVYLTVNSVVGQKENPVNSPFSTLFPNPSNGEVNLGISENWSSGKLEIRAYNTSGQLVYQEHLQNIQPGENLRLSKKFENGFYLVQLKGDKRQETLPLLVH